MWPTRSLDCRLCRLSVCRLSVARFFCTGMNTSAIEYALELTYPSSEETVTSVMMMGCQVFGLAFTAVLAASEDKSLLGVLDDDDGQPSAQQGPSSPMAGGLFVVCGFTAIGACLAIAAKGPCRRQEAADLGVVSGGSRPVSRAGAGDTSITMG